MKIHPEKYSFPIEPASIKTRARSYFAAESYQEAIAFLQQCLQHYPELKFLAWYLGLAWFLAEDESRAGTIWFAALLEAEGMGELVEILATEASIQLQQRKFRIAQKLFEQVLELDCSKAEYYFNWGNALAQQADFEGAMAAWQQATELNPHYLEAYQNQASVWQELADYPQAITAYQKVLDLNPNCLDSLYNLGICYSENNQLEPAISFFQACLELKPKFSQAYVDLGYILLQKGQIEEAIFLWKIATKINPKFSQYYWNWTTKISQIKSINNHNIFANASLLQSLELDSPRGKVCFHLANLLVNRGNYELGIKCYRKALELQFNNADVYSNLIVSLMAISNLEGAKFYLKILAQINLKKSQKLINLINDNNLGSKAAIPLIKSQIISINSSDESKVNNSSLLQGFYETALNWAVTCNLEKTHYYPIYPENTINLKPPNTPDQYIHYSFRFGEKVNLPASFVVVIPEGRFWLSEDEARSAVITPDNQIIGDLSPESPALSPRHPDKHPSKHSLFSRSLLPNIQYIDGKVVILAGLLNNVYFHWLFDILPRIHLLNLSGIHRESIDYFVVNNQLPFQRETLQILGISEEKIIGTTTFNHIQAKQLIVPSFPGTIAWMPKWACDYIKQSLHELDLSSTEVKKRIYISRNKSTNRRLINEEEIIDFLQKYDFEVVNLESMSVREQAKLLSQAEVVISPHGSGLSNLVFCQKGTKVIEILSPFYVYPCYWLISNLVELEYYYILGKILGSWHLHKLLYSDSRSEDIYIDKKSLKALINFSKLNLNDLKK
jgi:tetratricopeptide (TPR) repeat protein